MIDDFAIELKVMNRFYETEDGQRELIPPNTHDKETETNILSLIAGIISRKYT